MLRWWWERASSARPRDERGSVLPMIVLLVTVITGFTAVAVDLGVQRVAASDMQAVADLAALDAARQSASLTSCNDSALTTAANRSYQRYTEATGGKPAGTVSPLVAKAGRLDPVTQDFVAASGGAGCNAVRVTASSTVKYSFAPAIGRSSGSASRAAVGTRAQPVLCFSAGTRALVLNSSESALGPLLDRILRVNLGVAGYSGLVDLKNLSVPLGDVAAELNIGSTSQLAAANVTLKQFTAATATVLRRQGSTAQANVLDSVSSQFGALTLNLSRFLSVDTTSDAALSAQVSALDLIGSAVVSAAVANGKNSVTLGTDLNVPLDLVTARSRLAIIEPPVIACGGVGSKARTAQVRVDVATGVNVFSLTSAGNVSMGLQVASGTAELTAVTCASSSGQASTTVSGTTSLASLGGYNGSGYATVTPLSVLGIPLLGTVRLQGSVGEKTTTQQFPYPPAPALTQIFGGGERVIITSPDSTTNAVLTDINRLTGMVDLLVRPLLKLLGMELGIMEVRMLGTPSCGSVRLVG